MRRTPRLEAAIVVATALGAAALGAQARTLAGEGRGRRDPRRGGGSAGRARRTGNTKLGVPFAAETRAGRRTRKNGRRPGT